MNGECQKKDGSKIGADEIGKGVKDSLGKDRRRGEESEWKRKLRNKLIKREGNKEVLRGSIMGEFVVGEESEWKRKLREKLRKRSGNEDILKGSLLAYREL